MPTLTGMPLEVMNHIGSHLKPHSVVRLGQALKTSTGMQFRLGHMKEYQHFAAAKIQSAVRAPHLQFIDNSRLAAVLGQPGRVPLRSHPRASSIMESGGQVIQDARNPNEYSFYRLRTRYGQGNRANIDRGRKPQPIFMITILNNIL